MGIRVVLQSRLTSTRLPGKAMLSVGGMPIALLAAKRAENTGLEVVLATSCEAEDDIIESAAARAGISVVRGSLNDTLDRFLVATSDLSSGDIVVRLTADNLFPDGSFVEGLTRSVSSSCPYVRIGGADSKLPYGIAGEAFQVDALREASRFASPDQREHVTTWIRENLSDSELQFEEVFGSHPNPKWAGMRCTIDTLEDYVRVARLFMSIDNPIAIPCIELIERLERQESLANLAPSTLHLRYKVRHTPLTLGTAQIGMEYGIANTTGFLSDKQAVDLLEEAQRLGCSHVDTARAYGLSETRIGNARSDASARHLGIVTKLRPLSDVSSTAPVEQGRIAVRKSLDESLGALRTQVVDAVLCHRANDWFKPGVREALVEFRAAGQTQAIGASVSTPSELMQLLADSNIDYVQIPFNILDPRWLDQEVQNRIQSRPDVVIAARSVFLQGLLLASNGSKWPENIGIGQREIKATLKKLVRALGLHSTAELALLYVLSQSWITTAVIGVDTVQQLREIVDLAREKKLTGEQLSLIRNSLPPLNSELVDPSRWEFAE